VKQAVDYLAEALLAGAFLVCWVGTAGLLWLSVGASVGSIQWESLVGYLYSKENVWALVLLDVFAFLLFFMGLYFLALFFQARRRWKRIQHEGPRGPIEISLFAIRSYIERVLANEFGLYRYRVALEKTGDGLHVFIRAELPIGRNVLDTAEKIQQTIEENVEDRIGVKVHRVQVIAAGIASEGPEERPLFRGEGEID
jgi:uncharacterized alkaline shock family protein YloU